MRNLYFDASVLQYPNYRGVHIYAYNLILEMAEIRTDTTFHLHFGMAGWNPLLDNFSKKANVRMIVRPGLIGRHLIPPVNVLRTKSTAYCMLNGNTGRLRFPVPCPTAAVFHDMRLILYPELYGVNECREFARQARKWIRKLNLVITGSETVKQEIQDYFGLTSDRIVVVSEGCDHRGSNRVPQCPQKITEDMPFFLTVNPSDIRKNLRCTLAAFSQYVNAHPEDKRTMLVIAGVITQDEEFDRWKKDFPEAAARAIPLGYVTEDKLVYLYQHAICSIYVSLYEGFGIPIIEAFREGCPTIVSDIPVFREVSGDASVYVNPHDPRGLCQAMVHLKETTELRQTLIKRGRVRICCFSWKKSAVIAVDALLAL